MTDEFLKNNYIPDVYQKTIHAIDYDLLKSSGIKLISFDIDETIAGDDEKDPPKTTVTLFENLKNKGFKIILLTNANNVRAKHFADILNVEYISNAKKPLTENFQYILKEHKLNGKQMAHIGNSQFDNTAGGNSVDIVTCLVDNCGRKPLSEDEIKLNRELKNRNLWDRKFYQLKRR